MFCIYDFHHYYLTISKSKQSKRKEKEEAQVLSLKLTHISYVNLGESLNFSMSVSTSVQQE